MACATLHNLATAEDFMVEGSTIDDEESNNNDGNGGGNSRLNSLLHYFR